MPKRPYSECTPTLTDYPRKVQRTERREDDTDVVDILADVRSYLGDGLDIPLVVVDGRRVFGRAFVNSKKYGSRLFRVTNPVCGKTPGYATYIYRSLSLHPFFDSKEPFNLSGWNYHSQKDVSIVKVEMKIPHSYSLPRKAMNLLLFHQVAQHKVDAKAEREICDILLIAAENPEFYPLRWMTAMKVALLYKPFNRQAVLNAIARAMRRRVRHAKAIAVTTQEQFRDLCDELLVEAVFCKVGDKRQFERKQVLQIVGERMKRKTDVDKIIEDADDIMKSGSSPWLMQYIQQVADAVEDLRPSLALNGYREVLENLNRHPIQEALNTRNIRDIHFSTLRAGAELCWPTKVMDMLENILRASSKGEEGFEERIATPIFRIQSDTMMSQAELSYNGLRDAENSTILIQEAFGGRPPIGLVLADDDDEEDAGVSSSSMGPATDSRRKVRLLGTWARRPLASLRAEYGRVELIVYHREEHVYRTTTRITSAKTWRAHGIAQSLDCVSEPSKPRRSSPLKSNNTPANNDGRNNNDAADPDAESDMPKRKLVAENNVLDTLYRNIWRKSLAAIETEASSRERVLLARIAGKAETQDDAMEL